mgnify:CR=1 FL=1
MFQTNFHRVAKNTVPCMTYFAMSRHAVHDAIMAICTRIVVS